MQATSQENTVPPELTSVLVALREGWEPQKLVEDDLDHIASATGDDVTLTPSSVTLELANGLARIRVEGFDFLQRKFASLSGKLDAGASFMATSCIRRTEYHHVSDASCSFASTYEFLEWFVGHRNSAKWWVGEVEGNLDVFSGGNLVIERLRPGPYRCGARRHFRLEGVNTYYLVNVGQQHACRWFLVVEPKDKPLDDSTLSREFFTLQFALGTHLRVSTLTGISAARETVALRHGVASQTPLQGHPIRPVPIQDYNGSYVDECWAADIFSAICKYRAEEHSASEAVSFALDMYMQTLNTHIEGDYLRLHVALEALAFRAGNEGKREVIVTDKRAWNKWVLDHESEIENLAVEGKEKSLSGKVMEAKMASTGVVENAFKRMGLELLPIMLKELGKGDKEEGNRNQIVHQGTMGTTGRLESLRKVSIVRTMLVALLARLVGYDGAICGWDAKPPKETNAEETNAEETNAEETNAEETNAEDWFRPTPDAIQRARQVWYADVESDGPT